MRRFRSVRSGVIVTVDDKRAEAMGPGFEPFEAKPKPLTAAQKKALAKAEAEEVEAAKVAAAEAAAANKGDANK